jgi:peptidoglycan/LPS O-acetylase OafA/YrhL
LSEKNSPHQTSFALWLDVFRWVAAAAVLVTHTGNRLLIRYQDVPEADRMWVHLGYQFASGFAHQAVIVFFVISGFLVGGSVWQEFRQTRDVNLAHFMTKRLIRLCIVLFPVFLIGGMLDYLGAGLLDGAKLGIYTPELLDRLNATVLACNMVFLQNFACWQYGTNGALWSLAHEFWYYLLWPLALLAMFSQRPARTRLFILALVVAGCVYFSTVQFTGSPLLPYMLIWLLGVWAAACKRPLAGNVVIAAILLVAALLAIRLFVRYENFVGMTAFSLDIGIAILFANLIAAMRLAPKLVTPAGGRIHQRLAEFSFSLYCWHTPVLMFYAAVMMQTLGTGWQMVPLSAGNWVIVAGGLSVCITFSYLMSLITEKNTNHLRRWVFARAGWKEGAKKILPAATDNEHPMTAGGQ